MLRCCIPGIDRFFILIGVGCGLVTVIQIVVIGFISGFRWVIICFGVAGVVFVFVGFVLCVSMKNEGNWDIEKQAGRPGQVHGNTTAVQTTLRRDPDEDTPECDAKPSASSVLDGTLPIFILAACSEESSSKDDNTSTDKRRDSSDEAEKLGYKHYDANEEDSFPRRLRKSSQQDGVHPPSHESLGHPRTAAKRSKSCSATPFSSLPLEDTGHHNDERLATDYRQRCGCSPERVWFRRKSLELGPSDSGNRHHQKAQRSPTKDSGFIRESRDLKLSDSHRPNKNLWKVRVLRPEGLGRRRRHSSGGFNALVSSSRRQRDYPGRYASIR